MALIVTMESHFPLQHRVAPGFSGLRLDRYLHLRFPWHSRAHIQSLIQSGRVEGGRPLKPSSRVLEGEALTLWVEKKERREEESVSTDLPVVYDDPWLMAVDKPAGLLSHPVRFDRKVAVVTLLRERFSREGSAIRPTLCHRLDRETSGLLLLAKDPVTDATLKKAFVLRRVHKEYLAIVHGSPPWEKIVLDAPLGPHPHSHIGILQGVRSDGAPARTSFCVVNRYPPYSLIGARPETGRMHQIRAHLHHLGFPLVGDKLYGPPPSLFLGWLETGMTPEVLSVLHLPRHALHATRLTLTHPRSGAPLSLHAPMPADMRALLSSSPLQEPILS